MIAKHTQMLGCSRLGDTELLLYRLAKCSGRLFSSGQQFHHPPPHRIGQCLERAHPLPGQTPAAV
jgi:hypothetical protein